MTPHLLKAWHTSWLQCHLWDSFTEHHIHNSHYRRPSLLLPCPIPILIFFFKTNITSWNCITYLIGVFYFSLLTFPKNISPSGHLHFTHHCITEPRYTPELSMELSEGLWKNEDRWYWSQGPCLQFQNSLLLHKQDPFHSSWWKAWCFEPVCILLNWTTLPQLSETNLQIIQRMKYSENGKKQWREGIRGYSDEKNR